jgi:hypothetical protein
MFKYIRCEFSTKVKIRVIIYWVMTPCSLVGRSQTSEDPVALKLEVTSFSEILVNIDQKLIVLKVEVILEAT